MVLPEGRNGAEFFTPGKFHRCVVVDEVDGLVVSLPKRPETHRDVIGKEVTSVQVVPFSAVDVAAGDTQSAGGLCDIMGIFVDRFMLGRWCFASDALFGGLVSAFARAPAEVLSLEFPGFDEIYFLPVILSDIGDPERACLLVEGAAPGIAETVGIDFGFCVFPPDKGVILGNAGGISGNIQAKD